MRALAFLVSLVLLSCSQNDSRSKTNIPTESLQYYGYGSTEAILSFDFFVEISSSAKPSKSEATQAVEDQVQHLFGTMASSKSFAVPKENHEIRLGRIESVEGTKNYKAYYSYRGTIVLKNGPKTKFEVVLPYNPSTIYEASKVGGKSRCTDSHYDGEEDFWYFWSPDPSVYPRCTLREGVDFARVEASIERLPNTVETYPEYDRLVKSVNGRDTIVISVLMGMDETTHLKNPLISKDLNALNYRKLRRELEGAGFEGTGFLSKQEVSGLVGHDLKGRIYLEEFRRKGSKADILVRMFFGPTGMDEKSGPFHWLFKHGLEEASVVMYDGHSGLGGHLDLADMEKAEDFKIQPNKKAYQIYFFNSCSSYPYYNTMFFKRKRTPADPAGTKNLDILTNGLASAFESSLQGNWTALTAIIEWTETRKRTSYQSLVKNMDDDALLGINGDEDNN